MWNRSWALALVWTLLVHVTCAQAELQPDELAIIAVRTSRESRDLADYYAQARGVPKSQICLIDCQPGETISRAEWETKVRPGIRHWLAANGLEKKVRCLVTVWDVPLRIGGIDPKSALVADITKHLEGERRKHQEQIVRVAVEMDKLLPGGEAPPVRAVPGPDATQKEYGALLEAALKGAQAKFQAISQKSADAKDGDKPDRTEKERKDRDLAQQALRLEMLFHRSGGVATVLRSLQQQVENNPKAPPQVVRSFEFRRGEFAGLRAGMNLLSTLPESVERDHQLLLALRQSDGALGSLIWIELQQDLWKKNESQAAFDNELALLHWPAHALLRWQSNLLHYAFDGIGREDITPTLMVARLEAPTLDQARRLVDSAIATEKTGLAGKVYLDARGMAADKNPGSYGEYDQSLRDLEKFLKQHTSLEVVFDNQDKLFGPGECPEAALYCGWYALSNYVDAFEWKPGSVGYHMASGEATTLRQKSSNVWCKRMLEMGVAGTLGPTFEPYLGAFPKPLDFFPLLLTGKLTLVETYARTSPYTSWAMVLVGDPLYNPFKNAPQFDDKQLPDHVKRLLGEFR